MIVTKTLNVSAQEYFELLQTYLLKDLKKHVSFQIKKSDLKAGYQFDKEYPTKQGNTFVSHHEIIKMDEPYAYTLKYTIPKGWQSISHTITEIDDTHIKVVYEECIESSSLSIKLRQLINRGKSRKAMNDVLNRLELEILTSK